MYNINSIETACRHEELLVEPFVYLSIFFSFHVVLFSHFLLLFALLEIVWFFWVNKMRQMSCDVEWGMMCVDVDVEIAGRQVHSLYEDLKRWWRRKYICGHVVVSSFLSLFF